MKSKSLLIAMALSMIAGGAFAQSRDSIGLSLIPFHNIGGVPQNLMYQHDGDIVSKVGVSTPTTVATVFYKLSQTGAEITDTLFVPDGSYQGHYFLMAKNPDGEGNVRVNAEPNGEGGTNLRISHFPDNDFIGNPMEDIIVPLCDEEILDYPNLYMIDCRGDIIWKYHTYITDSTYQGHIARFDLDGTLKHHALVPENQNFITHFGVLSEQPLRYYQWNGHDNLTLYVLDSLFQLENFYVINKGFLPEYNPSIVHFNFSNNLDAGTFVIPDGDDVLVAAPYSDYSAGGYYYNLETGIAVARYELRTMQQKSLVMFNDYPGPESEVEPLCFFKSSDGCLYYVYKEAIWDDNGYDLATPIIAVKMDPYLNILWKRYIDTPKDHQLYSINYSDMEEDDEGVRIVVSGNNIRIDKTTTPWTFTLGLLYFFLTEESVLGLNESGIEVRPYCFYPNPAKGQLHMQFSPDVLPKQIELYDLQGRSVRVQNIGFEGVDMSRLPVGTYMMRVTLEDGKVFSEKVVKE